MNKVIELAREAGLWFVALPEEYCIAVGLPVGHIGAIGDVTIDQIEKFCELARADLEAEIEVGAQQIRHMMRSHNKAFDDFTAKVAALEAQREAQGVACLRMSKKMAAMEAENAKLRKALYAASNYVDGLGGVSASYRQKLNDEYGEFQKEREAARAALGEKRND